MQIRTTILQNFRSYQRATFAFAPNTTLIVGPNASGKTNLLEALCLLATGRSLRAEVESEMIRYGEEMSNVKCSANDGSNEDTLEIVLTRGEVIGKNVAKKIYRVNGVGKRMMDFVGILRTVYFGPESLEIIVNSPSLRRDYLDSVLEPVDREYFRASLSYKKGLRQRNRLLEQIRDEGKPRSSLFFWDRLLVENGQAITQKREEFIESCNKRWEKAEGVFPDLKIIYKESVISPLRLEKYAHHEVAAGMTLVGPHRDDFSVSAGQRNLHSFGSRGEQRIAMFAIKLAELEFVSEKTKARPVLLLDDIFSELDHNNRQHLLEVIPCQQTIITTTDLHLIPKEYLKKVKVIELGKV